MQPYIRIRIDKDSLIPVPTRTEGLGEGSLYLYFENDPDEKPTIVSGEMADALRAWISGSKIYPVTENGVLNIYGSVVDGIAAERSLGQFPLMDYGKSPYLLDNMQDSPTQTVPKGLNTPPNAVPTIDINKVIKGIQERK